MGETKDALIKKFREVIQKAFVDKGIRPPQEGSKKEQVLYLQWLKIHQINGNK